MANERKTETLVRETLRAHGYFDDDALTVDEQRSDNPRIQELLKTGLKGRTGGGKSEFYCFLSRFPRFFLVVIECKADPSSTRVQLATGMWIMQLMAHFYTLRTCKEYDVLAIRG